MMAANIRSFPSSRTPARPANNVVKRNAFPHALPRALWWQPGVYGSGPAVLLWIVARLPADTLAEVFGTPLAAALFNHAGDTVFVTGWLASAAWLWFTRRRPPPAKTPAAVPPEAATHPNHHHPG